MSSALKAVAQEFGLQIAFYSESTDGIDAPALRGRYTSEQALAELLDDTSLEHSFISGLVRRRPPPDQRKRGALRAGKIRAGARINDDRNDTDAGGTG